jgi:SAM-dependent methyltransferase
MISIPADVWASGSAYEPYMGRWSRLVARELTAWLAMPPGAVWLDVGCGTGALTAAVLATAAPAGAWAVDASVSYARYSRLRIRDRRAAFAAADARSLPFAAGSIDVVVSGLVLNFVPRPDLVVKEMARVARPGGVVAAYVWDYAKGMQMLRTFWDAATAVDPTAAALDEGRRFPLGTEGAMPALWRDAGLLDVEERALEVPTTFRDFDDYWAPFLGGQGPAPSYLMGLDPHLRERLRERVRAALPASGGGAIALTARAWAVRGVRDRLRHT